MVSHSIGCIIQVLVFDNAYIDNASYIFVAKSDSGVVVGTASVVFTVTVTTKIRSSYGKIAMSLLAIYGFCSD